METTESGRPWTKFWVPSIGSTIHVGVSLGTGGTRPSAAAASSPITLCAGKRAASVRVTSASFASSVAVTGSMPAFSPPPSLSFARARPVVVRIAAPHCSARSTATAISVAKDLKPTVCTHLCEWRRRRRMMLAATAIDADTRSAAEA
eukprot:7391802-Prymnesium_polylepis.1